MNKPLFNRLNWLKLGLLIIAMISISPVRAQFKTDSLLLMEMGINAGAWQLSANPIFLNNRAVPKFAKVGFTGDLITGKYRRPQDFQKQKLLGFGATGLSNVGNWLFFGSFDYSKKYRDSIKYANVVAPYDGNPFITGDALGGNWRGDGLAAQLQVVLPKMKSWQTALKFDYATQQNSRANDPRPLNRLLNYAVQPSVAYHFNQKHTLSLLAGYSFSDETIETGFYADQNPIIYNIRGYGEFSAGPVVTSQRFTKGYGFNFGLDYRYKNQGELLFGARFAYRTQDVNEGVAKPVFIGGFDETKGEAFLSYLQENGSKGWMASARGWFRDGTGFDPIFKSINPAYYFSGLDAKIAYWVKGEHNRLLQIAVYPAISYTNYFEGIAKTDWTSIMLHQDAGISLLSYPAKRTSLLAELRLGYHFNLDQQLVINRPSMLSPILVSPYFQYASVNYLSAAMKLSATYQAARVAYQLGGSFDLRKTEHLGSRSFSNIFMNLIF